MDMIIASGKLGVGVIRKLSECLMGKVCQKNRRQVLLFQSLKENGM